MDKAEIRAILSAYRPGQTETADRRFAEALVQVEADPELSHWWAEQQEVDRIIAQKLQSVKVPADLKARVTAWEKRASRRSGWNRALLAAAAGIVALAAFFGSWRGPFQPAASLGDFREEMVSFVKLTPPLELKSEELSRITAFLEKAGAPSRFSTPGNFGKMEPVGCRTLRFRGYDVALVCFKRADGRLAHLFVTDRAALPHLPAFGSRDYAAQGEWMTAAWTEGDRAYLVAVQGDHDTLDKYLTSS